MPSRPPSNIWIPVSPKTSPSPNCPARPASANFTSSVSFAKKSGFPPPRLSHPETHRPCPAASLRRRAHYPGQPGHRFCRSKSFYQGIHEDRRGHTRLLTAAPANPYKIRPTVSAYNRAAWIFIRASAGRRARRAASSGAKTPTPPAQVGWIDPEELPRPIRGNAVPSMTGSAKRNPCTGRTHR